MYLSRTFGTLDGGEEGDASHSAHRMHGDFVPHRLRLFGNPVLVAFLGLRLGRL